MTELRISAREAAFQAMDEVSGPVVAIVLVLCAVFLPTAVLGGTTGQLFKQFAVTIAVSVALSGFVALTLTPALAALMLEPHHGLGTSLPEDTYKAMGGGWVTEADKLAGGPPRPFRSAHAVGITGSSKPRPSPLRHPAASVWGFRTIDAPEP